MDQTSPIPTVPLLVGLSAIAGFYRALLCDVWGVVHNGIAAYPGTAEALTEFRAQGGHVLLVTNAPRPSAPIRAQLAELGFPDAAYDGILASGDVTQADLIARGIRRVHMIGPNRDLGLFEDTDMALTTADEAEIVVCTGLVNDLVETPEDYRATLVMLAERGFEFVCANPDVLVEKGDRLLYCSGALAAIYEELGGRVTQYGKPHPPVYAAAMERLSQMLGGPVDRKDVLVIGDGLFTDIKGAVDNGFDALFVTAGVHTADFGGPQPETAAVSERLHREGLTSIGHLPRLCW